MVIQLCREQGFMSIVFEGDAKVVIDAVNAQGQDWSRLEVYIVDIQREIQVIQN